MVNVETFWHSVIYAVLVADQAYVTTSPPCNHLEEKRGSKTDKSIGSVLSSLILLNINVSCTELYLRYLEICV